MFFSPIQCLYWTQPLPFLQLLLRTRPELLLWRLLPTTWDDTRVLSGAIGEHVLLARRTGDDWLVAAVSNTSARTLTLNLSLLFDHTWEGGTHPLPRTPRSTQADAYPKGFHVRVYEDDDSQDNTEAHTPVRTRAHVVLPPVWSSDIHRASLDAPVSAAAVTLQPIHEDPAAQDQGLHSSDKVQAQQVVHELTSSLLTLHLAPSGGAIVYLTPVL